MPDYLDIDFETFSEVDLTAAGADVYAKHPSTEVLCMSFAWNGGAIYDIGGDDTAGTAHLMRVFGDRIRQILKRFPDVQFRAFNAAFEIAIATHVCVSKYGWPVIPLERWECTMALSLSMSLPGGLANAALATGIEAQKDMEGHRLMMRMCKLAKATGERYDGPEQRARLRRYCQVDVRTQVAQRTRLAPHSDAERATWLLDQRINNRGIGIDRTFAAAARAMADAETLRLDNMVREHTNGYVQGAKKVAQMKDWIEKVQGVPIGSLNKNIVEALLETPDDSDEDPIEAVIGGMPEAVRTLLEYRLASAKSSTAKLDKMLLMSSVDGRARGLFQFYGALTGRWGGRGIQVQNLPRWRGDKQMARVGRGRIKFGDVESMIALIKAGDRDLLNAVYGMPLHCISDCLRSALVPSPGMVYSQGDWSNIEGRVLAWTAGEQWKLDAFRAADAGTGPGLYEMGAAKLLGKRVEDVTADDRQTYGKVPELALGFQGGVNAFVKMGVTLGAIIPEDVAENAKNAWRAANRQIVQHWYDLERAAKNAIRYPGTVFEAGGRYAQVRYQIDGSFLRATLPSGRHVYYPYARLDGDEQICYKSVGLNRKFTENTTYGGKLAENNTQAIARDVLRGAMLRADAAGLPIVLHCHDEIVTETAHDVQSELTAAMSEPMRWTGGLPLKVETWCGERYRK